MGGWFGKGKCRYVYVCLGVGCVRESMCDLGKVLGVKVCQLVKNVSTLMCMYASIYFGNADLFYLLLCMCKS